MTHLILDIICIGIALINLWCIWKLRLQIKDMETMEARELCDIEAHMEQDSKVEGE